MNKPLLLILTLDTVLLLAVSALVGGAFSLMGFHFLPAALLTLAGITAIGVFSNMIIEGRTAVSVSRLENDTAKLLASQTLIANCAYCNAQNSALFKVNEDMTFICSSCKQPNKIIWQYGAARITTPLDVKLPTEDLIPNSELDKE